MGKDQRKRLEPKHNRRLSKHVVTFDQSSHNLDISGEEGKDGEKKVKDVDSIEQADVINRTVASTEGKVDYYALEVYVEHQERLLAIVLLVALVAFVSYHHHSHCHKEHEERKNVEAAEDLSPLLVRRLGHQ